MDFKTLTLNQIETIFNQKREDKKGGTIATFSYYKVDEKSGIVTLVQGKQFRTLLDYTKSKYYTEPTTHRQTNEVYEVDKAVKFNTKKGKHYVVVYPFASTTTPTIKYYDKDGNEMEESVALAILKPKKETTLPPMKVLMADQIISIT